MKRKKGMVFITDKWGRFDDGGIDVFNQKLCEAMGYVMNREEAVVVCLVIGTVEDWMVERAKECNVIVIFYNSGKWEPEENICKYAVKKLVGQVPDTEFVWIGHDIKSGERAYNMSQRRNEKSAVIFHTNYYSIHADRRNNVYKREDGSDNVGKDTQQGEIAKKVDYVFCIGPKVFDRFKGMNRREKGKAILIIPGLEEKQDDDNEKNKNIMIAGRFYGDSETQKNWKSVCQAVELALIELENKGINITEYITTIYGFDPKMTDDELNDFQIKVNAEYNSSKIRPVIQLKRFDNSRKNYLKELEKSAIFVMGSELESFGMVAWEALALEVPIVISESSGLYEYLDNELGYLLRGLCGTFPARKDDNIECMGKSIADILVKPEKMQKATELLRDRMSVNKWENLAITVAKKVGINAVMDEMTYKDHNCFEFTYVERGLLFSEIKAQVENKKVKERIVFFGGISRKLFWLDQDLEVWNNQFASSLVELLSNYPNVHVYFCYETGSAIEQRGSEMGEEMEKKEEILQLKAEKIGTLDKMFEQRYKDFGRLRKRFHLVPLTKSPSVYINILDEDWYFSLKYENRTTQNTTMKLRNGPEGKSEKERLHAHMKFILSDNKDEAECGELLSTMEDWRIKYRYE